MAKHEQRNARHDDYFCDVIFDDEENMNKMNVFRAFSKMLYIFNALIIVACWNGSKLRLNGLTLQSRFTIHRRCLAMNNDVSRVGKANLDWHKLG